VDLNYLPSSAIAAAQYAMDQLSPKILVSEIFGPTIQGEGALTGRLTVFVRTGGCDFKCLWCDSMHAVDVARKNEWQPMTPEAILDRVRELASEPILITLSGGNPALQPVADLIKRGRGLNYTFALETQGSIAKPWFRYLDHLILSPKPPSSGMPFRPSRLVDCIHAADPNGTMTGPKLSLKVVVMRERDFWFARMIYDTFAKPQGIPFFITPGNATPGGKFDLEGLRRRTGWLVKRVAEDRWYDVSIIPQIHTLIWENQQGV
jgi:7-carboxy-7-deazaguanine synthase